MLIGLPSITEKLIIYLPVTVFCSIMNHHDVVYFVTKKKITRVLSRIHYGLEDCLYIGNLDSLRDWGHARDYVEMQWKMLQLDEPQDFVIATGDKLLYVILLRFLPSV